MKKITVYLLITTVFVNQILRAQESKLSSTYIGLGAGLDYGGIGLKAEIIPINQIGIFAGAGYNFHKIGINAGLSYKVLLGKKVVPVIMGMYGYNGVIRRHSFFNGSLIEEKTYYGFSAGAGCDIHFKKNRNKMTLAIVVPFRSSAFKEKYDFAKFYGQDLKPDVSNVLATVGFNFSATTNTKK